MVLRVGGNAKVCGDVEMTGKDWRITGGKK